MKKFNLLTTAAIGGMTAAERSKGRFMRAPDGHDSDGAPANSGGAADDSSQSDDDKNNTGPDAVLDGFWDQPKEEKPAGDSKSAGGNEENLGAVINTAIKEANFGAFMTPEVMADLADNKFEKFNGAINQALQGSIQKSIELNTQILGKFGDALFAKVAELIDEKSNSKENADFLSKEIPSANDPKLRPVVETIYAQALKINGNNRTKAIATTKAMMRTMAQSSSGDLNLRVVDADEADNSPSASPTNWVSELMAKK